MRCKGNEQGKADRLAQKGVKSRVISEVIDREQWINCKNLHSNNNILKNEPKRSGTCACDAIWERRQKDTASAQPYWHCKNK